MTGPTFEDCWRQQEEFMRLLQEKRGFPTFPVDLSSKSGQKIVKAIIQECVVELVESLTLLKNSKDHRITDMSDINEDEYVEELIDAQKYLLEVAILSGISRERYLATFLTKGDVNTSRINGGY